MLESSKWLFLILLGETLSLLSAGVSYSETISGRIGGSGSSINFRTIITEEDTSKSHILCPGSLSKKISQYKRMIAKVTVNKAKNCSLPTEFTLIKTPSGEEPVVGTLKKEGESFIVVNSLGSYSLGKISARLKKLKDQKVVLELKKSKNENQKNLYNVMYFAKAPSN